MPALHDRHTDRSILKQKMSERYKRRSESDYDSSAKRRRSDDTSSPPMYLVFNGEVSSVQPYGIFVKIPGTRRQGLVHKSQISKSRVEDATEMFAKGEMVYCKIISIDHQDSGDKIGLAMKNVNQTTGQDLDPNNIELSQDEKKRRQGGYRHDRKKIELDAVYDTTCRKCGGKGHLAQDCFKSDDVEKKYELIPEMDEYMKSLSQEGGAHASSHSHKKKKKEKKEKKEKKKKREHKKEYSGSSDSDSDKDGSPKKHKKKKRHHRRSYSSSSDG